MFQYRITKYNPVFRDANDVFTKDVWTDYGDIGKKFDDELLTQEEYDKVEEHYINCAYILAKKADVKSLNITQDGSHKRNGEKIPLNNLKEEIKKILRNEQWFLLESDNFFIHIGYDFYMYIGTDFDWDLVSQTVVENYLHIEMVDSPYSKTRNQ